jgi:hypothetical protein
MLSGFSRVSLAIVFLVFILVFGCAWLGFIPSFGGHNSFRVVQGWLFLFIVLHMSFLLLYSRERIEMALQDTMAAGCLLVVWFLICGLFNGGWLDVWLWVFLIVTVAILACLGCLRGNDFLLRSFYFLMLFIHCLVIFKSLAYLVVVLFLGASILPQDVYAFGENIRFFNQIQVLMFSGIFWVIRRWFGVGFLLLILEFYLLFLGGARGALLTVFFLMCIVPLLKDGRFYLKAVSLALVLAFIAHGVVGWAAAVGGPGVSRYDSSFRIPMWLAIIKSLNLTTFFVGNGPGSFVFFSGNHGYGHPHNVLMQLLYEVGVAGVILFCVFVGRIVKPAWSRLRSLEFGAEHGVLLGVLCGLFYSLFDGVFVMPGSQLLIFIFLGLLWSGNRRAAVVEIQSDAARVEHRAGGIGFLLRLVLGLTLVVAALAYNCAVYQSFYACEQSVEAYTLGPRFWLHGWHTHQQGVPCEGRTLF